MSSPVIQNFMRQQGFPDEASGSCDLHFAGLYFQPRIVFPSIVAGVILNIAGFVSAASAVFLALSIVLWWNTLVPRLNPFELVYNRRARLRGSPELGTAPAPRRFAQGMAASLLTGASLCLILGAVTAAAVLEGLLVVAFAALLFGRFCLGAYVYHVLRGEAAFANSTLPWARNSPS